MTARMTAAGPGFGTSFTTAMSPSGIRCWTPFETLSVGVSVQYRFRLPKIDRSNPDDVRPHATRNVRTWVSNNASAESGWRIMMRDFDAAVKRYDRDPSVRVPGGLRL